MLVSRNNPRIKYIRRLGNRNFREKEGKFLVEGVRFLEEALRESWPLEFALYVTQVSENPRGEQVLEMLARQGVPLLAVDSSLFAELAETRSPQGIMAVARMPGQLKLDPGYLLNGDKDLLVMVDCVRDPGNLGTIIRCADAYDAGGVILSKGTVDPFNPKTLRATMGAVFRVPLFQLDNRTSSLACYKMVAGRWWRVIRRLESKSIIATCPGGCCWQLEAKHPVFPMNCVRFYRKG